MRRSWLAGLLVGVAVLTGVGFADVQVGDLRAVQGRAGTALRREPTAFAPVVATLPYGTYVAVQEVRGPYARVTTQAGEGWVRVGEIVEPVALTGGGALGPAGSPTRALAGAGTGTVTSAEVSAAGRQFDEEIERGYRAENANLGAAYAALDQIERTKPSAEEVEAFIRDGRLGR
jgi:hypothetical protein